MGSLWLARLEPGLPGLEGRLHGPNLGSPAIGLAALDAATQGPWEAQAAVLEEERPQRWGRESSWSVTSRDEDH